jgi:hypothetical protein
MALFRPAGTNYVPVLDLAAAASWYADIFDLRPRPTKFDDGQKGIELSHSSDYEDLFFVLGPANVPNDGETPMLLTSHILKAKDYLSSRGVNVGEIQRDRQGTRFFEMRDSEGNVIEISVEP